MPSTPYEGDPGRARVDRWRTSAQVLDAVRRDPGLTRVELTRRLALSSASATETIARLREAGWLCEHRAPVTGRGRPTTTVLPAPEGPQVLAIDLRHEDWRCAVAGLDGVPTVVGSGRLRRDTAAVLELLRGVVTDVVAGLGTRVVAIGLAAPAPVSGDAFTRAPELDWAAGELGTLVAGLGPAGVPVLPGNDATLAGLAEARHGAARGAATALYLTVEVGLGGALLLDGRPQTGRHGAGGEYGHLPFGDPSRRCGCGADGCWGPEVDGRALARHLGEPVPDDPRTYAGEVLARAAAGEDRASRATDTVAVALGRGVAGLVNAHDPDVVVLGGLGPGLHRPSFDHAYRAGLMAFLREAPPPVLDAVHGDDGALVGAAAVALDHATTPEALARALTPAGG